MNIAYIYICHNNPEMLRRVAKALEYKNDMIFVHVDKKTDERPFYEESKECTNIVFLKDRIDNYWGGFNSIIVTIKLLKFAREHGGYSRYVLLQGQDFPLVSAEKIHAFFEENETEYCKAKDITVSKKKGDYMKWAGYWYMDCCSRNPFKMGLRYLFNRINRLGIRYRKGTFDANGEPWHVYKGWAQFALTDSCVNHIISVYENNKAYNKFMKHRFPPDEIYIHTIIHNSPFRNKVSNLPIYNREGKETLLNVTYFEYPDEVTVFKEASEYAWLKETGCLFVRKVNTSSNALLKEIESHF